MLRFFIVYLRGFFLVGIGIFLVFRVDERCGLFFFDFYYLFFYFFCFYLVCFDGNKRVGYDCCNLIFVLKLNNKNIKY